jgi:hypothetical protein
MKKTLYTEKKRRQFIVDGSKAGLAKKIIA